MRSRHPMPRAAFTLFEMLIVLALIVGLLAVTYPSLNRLTLEHHLKQGAEMVKLQIAGMRLNAMQSGMDYQFRYEPGGKHFLAVPAEYQAIQAQNAAAQQSGNGAPVAVYWKAQGEFTVKIHFSSDMSQTFGQGVIVEPQPLPAEFLTGFPNSGQLASVAWAPPLIFKPDGSSRDFAVEIENGAGQYVVLEVRGITGESRVSPILRRVRS